MTTIKSILRRFCARATESEIEEELKFHIAMRTRDNIAAGMSPQEAAADAARRFGDFEHVKATCHEISRETLIRGVNMELMKGLTWVMLGCGVTLSLTSDITTVQQAGRTLAMIGLLWRLFIRFREAKPNQDRINRRLSLFDQEPLGIIVTASDFKVEEATREIATRDAQGRTPVERFLAGDEPQR